MHIADGIIDTSICVAAHVVSGGLLYMSGKKMPMEEIPGVGIMGAALFVASLVHFPFAGTSIHLGLFGIAGIILGKHAFPAIFTALLFQSLILQHGGLMTLGVNALNMGAGAYVAWMIWRMWRVPEYLRAILAGFSGIIVPAVLMTAEFRLSGYGKGIVFLFSVFLVTAVIESALTFSAVKFFRRVKPGVLREYSHQTDNVD